MSEPSLEQDRLHRRVQFLTQENAAAATAIGKLEAWAEQHSHGELWQMIDKLQQDVKLLQGLYKEHLEGHP